MIHYGIGHCALGPFLAGWSDGSLCAVGLADTPDQLVSLLRTDFPDQALKPATPEDSLSLQRIARFIDNPLSVPTNFPLYRQGTPFQQSVWRALADTSPGQTISYSELAHRLKKPKAVRAVASACSANRLAVIIPCHRVIRGDGSLGGYRWGLARKQALLQHEKALIESQDKPA